MEDAGIRRYVGTSTQASLAYQKSGPHSAQLGEFNPTSLPTNPSCDFRIVSLECGDNYLDEVVCSMLSCADNNPRSKLYELCSHDQGWISLIEKTKCASQWRIPASDDSASMQLRLIVGRR